MSSETFRALGPATVYGLKTPRMALRLVLHHRGIWPSRRLVA